MADQPNPPMFAPGGGTSQSALGLSSAAAAAVAQRGTPATLNLDDIFGDCFFTPEGETVFLNETPDGVVASGEGQNVATMASRPDPGNSQTYQPVSAAGGIQTTNLDKPGERALVMGKTQTQSAAVAKQVPFQQAPQRQHHMQFATPATASALKKRSRTTGGRNSSERKMSEQQKVERRYV